MADKQNPNPDNTPVDWDRVREKAAAFGRQTLAALPSLLVKGVSLFNPRGILWFLSRMAEGMQVRFTISLVVWLFCTFFLSLGLAEAVADGIAPADMFFLVLVYGIWALVNAAVHGIQRSDYRSYRPIYLVLFDMLISAVMLTLGITLYLGLASTLMGALICGVLVGTGLFAALVIQTERGELEDHS